MSEIVGPVFVRRYVSAASCWPKLITEMSFMSFERRTVAGPPDMPGFGKKNA